MSDINLKNIIEQYPDCVTNGAKLKGILLDTYPDIPKAIVNTLVIMVNSGIAKEIRDSENITELDKSRWQQKLEYEGFAKKVIFSCLNMFFAAFGLNVEKLIVETAESVSVQPENVLSPTNLADFEIKDGVLVKYNGNSADVVIPDGVTSIGNGTLSIGDEVLFGSLSATLYNSFPFKDKEINDNYYKGLFPFFNIEDRYLRWKIIDENKGRLLLYLCNDNFRDTFGVKSWESCGLRKELNSTFINNNFTAKEKGMIISTDVPSCSYKSTNSTVKTNDKVFILSIEEFEKYKSIINNSLSVIYLDSEKVSDNEGESDVGEIDWNKNKYRKIIGDEYKTFWFRNSGQKDSLTAIGAFFKDKCLISEIGGESFERQRIYVQVGEDDYDWDGEYEYYPIKRIVHPVLWVDSDLININLEGNSKIQNIGESISWERFKIKDIICFGEYYSNALKEKRPIDWIIIEIKNNGIAKLISRKCIELLPYNEGSQNKRVSWKDSSLRQWLNDSFYNNFWSCEKKALITDSSGDFVSILNAKHELDISRSYLDDSTFSPSYNSTINNIEELIDNRPSNITYKRGKKKDSIENYEWVKSNSDEKHPFCALKINHTMGIWWAANKMAMVRPVIYVDLKQIIKIKDALIDEKKKDCEIKKAKISLLQKEIKEIDETIDSKNAEISNLTNVCKQSTPEEIQYNDTLKKFNSLKENLCHMPLYKIFKRVNLKKEIRSQECLLKEIQIVAEETRNKRNHDYELTINSIKSDISSSTIKISNLKSEIDVLQTSIKLMKRSFI